MKGRVIKRDRKRKEILKIGKASTKDLVLAETFEVIEAVGDAGGHRIALHLLFKHLKRNGVREKIFGEGSPVVHFLVPTLVSWDSPFWIDQEMDVRLKDHWDPEPKGVRGKRRRGS